MFWKASASDEFPDPRIQNPFPGMTRLNLLLMLVLLLAAGPPQIQHRREIAPMLLVVGSLSRRLRLMKVLQVALLPLLPETL